MGKVLGRFVLTGGPKAGKSVIKEEVKKAIEPEYNCKVFLVQETATELIRTGIIPDAKPTDGDTKKWRKYFRSNLIFQFLILFLQIVKELVVEIAAKHCEEDVVIIYDRAILDNEGYIIKNLKNKKIFPRMLRMFGLTKQMVLDKYTGVISLETSAKIKEFGIQEEGDVTQRLEDGNMEAIEVDNCVSDAWKDHINYRRIPAVANFQDKIVMTIDAIRELLNKNLSRRTLK